MATQYARVESHRAALSEEFGRMLLAKKFGTVGADMVLDAFGVYRSGKRKGLPRGYIYWDKVTVGGWSRGEAGGLGGVRRPGSQCYAVGLGFDRTGKCMKERFEWPVMTDDEWHATLARGLGEICKGVA